jgi:hypothetical protein
LAALPWKLNPLLFGRPLLVAECATTMKSVWPVKPVSKKLTSCDWAPSVRPVVFLKMSPTHFCLEVWSP